MEPTKLTWLDNKFTGRMNRSSFFLNSLLLSFVFLLIGGIMIWKFDLNFSLIFVLILLVQISSVPFYTKRLHDVNKSATFGLIIFNTYLGLSLKQGDSSRNRFGEPPSGIKLL